MSCAQRAADLLAKAEKLSRPSENNDDPKTAVIDLTEEVEGQGLTKRTKRESTTSKEDWAVWREQLMSAQEDELEELKRRQKQQSERLTEAIASLITQGSLCGVCKLNAIPDEEEEDDDDDERAGGCETCLERLCSACRDEAFRCDCGDVHCKPCRDSGKVIVCACEDFDADPCCEKCATHGYCKVAGKPLCELCGNSHDCCGARR